MSAPSNSSANESGGANAQTDNAALREEIASLKQAQQAQIDLLAFVSHEIKAPIGAIKAMAELLYGTNLTDHQSHYVNTMCFALENIMRSADDMLHMAQVKREQLSYDLRAVNFPSLLSALALPIAQQARSKGLKFTAEMEKDVPASLWIDPNRFSQVVNNLANNAIKYTNQGSIKLAVSATVASAQEYTVTITITDTGKGIAKEEQEKIFGPFMQAQNAKEMNKPGSGLGLWISKEIAAGMNGAISCQSQESQGSIFTFAFKAKHGASQDLNSKDNAEPEAISTSQTPVPALSETELQATSTPPIETDQKSPPLKGHALIVEDNQINQMLIKIYLDKFGLTFDCIENGKQALDRLEQQTYDVVLMDILMPELDGLTTAKCLHDRWQENERIPIIALSASANAISGEEYQAVGIKDYVAKPISGEDLYQVLARHLIKCNGPKETNQTQHSSEEEGLLNTSEILSA